MPQLHEGVLYVLYLYILKSSWLKTFLTASSLYILMNALPWESAPEWRSRMEAPPADPPSARPRWAMLRRANASDGFTTLSHTTRPHFLGVHPGKQWLTYPNKCIKESHFFALTFWGKIYSAWQQKSVRVLYYRKVKWLIQNLYIFIKRLSISFTLELSQLLCVVLRAVDVNRKLADLLLLFGKRHLSRNCN